MVIIWLMGNHEKGMLLVVIWKLQSNQGQLTFNQKKERREEAKERLRREKEIKIQIKTYTALQGKDPNTFFFSTLKMTTETNHCADGYTLRFSLISSTLFYVNYLCLVSPFVHVKIWVLWSHFFFWRSAVFSIELNIFAWLSIVIIDLWLVFLKVTHLIIHL